MLGLTPDAAATRSLLVSGGYALHCSEFRQAIGHSAILLFPDIVRRGQVQRPIDSQIGQALRDELCPLEIVLSAMSAWHGNGERPCRNRRPAAVLAIFK